MKIEKNNRQRRNSENDKDLVFKNLSSAELDIPKEIGNSLDRINLP